MLRSAAGKAMWVGRTTIFLVGLAVMLALVFGVAATALGANGNPLLLGKKNFASAATTLVKRGVGPALKLQVGAGQPPLAVNSGAKVTNLNADSLDGLDSAQLAGFGETAYKRWEFVKTCSDKELVSKTFSVPRETLVYASAVANYSKNGTNGDQGVMRLQLLDASGTVVASAGSTDGFVQSGTASHMPLALQGVLQAGSDAYDTSASPFVATPGNQYKLRVFGGASGTCGATAGDALFSGLAVSYQLIGRG